MFDEKAKFTTLSWSTLNSTKQNPGPFPPPQSCLYTSISAPPSHPYRLMNFTTCICFSHKIPPHLHCSYPGSPGTLTWWVSSNFSCTWSFILPATSRWQLPKGHRVKTRAPLSDTRPSISLTPCHNGHLLIYRLFPQLWYRFPEGWMASTWTESSRNTHRMHSRLRASLPALISCLTSCRLTLYTQDTMKLAAPGTGGALSFLSFVSLF